MLVFFLQCRNNNTVKNENFYLNINDTVKYVGIEKCRLCHEDHYATFIKTGMGSSFGAATRLRSKAHFKNIKAIYDAKRDFFYYPFLEDTAIKIMEFRLRGKDTIYKRVETIRFIIGSGQHTNSHFWEDNGHLYQAPLTWYAQQGKWDLPPGFETTNTRFGRAIDIECMSCHNGMPALKTGSINAFDRLPAGIDCERCHGPGELHIQRKLKGEIIDVKTQADRSIVNPAKLPWKLQVDICQRCHLQGNNVLLAGKKFTDFRPGMHLDSVFTVYMPVKKGVQGFVMAGQAERLQMSQCFKISNKNNIQIYNPKINLTCITCHNPHVSVKETNIQKFNNACTQCHNANGNSNKKKCSEKAEKIAFMQNNCVKCHMPASATSDIPHVTVHDHYIRKPEKISLVKNSNEITDIKAVNTNNTDRKNYIEGLISYFEKFEAAPLIMQKAGVKLKEITNNSTLYVHYYFANQQWSKIILYASEIEAEKADAWTCYRMAKALDKTGKPAAEWYKNAYEKQNLNAGFAAEYANYLIRNNRLKEARIVLEKVYKQEEKNELILLNLGSVEMLEGNLSKAKNYWLQCLLLNPDNVLTRMNIAELYYKVGDLKQAKIEITEALRIDKNNAEAAAFLKNLY